MKTSEIVIGSEYKMNNGRIVRVLRSFTDSRNQTRFECLSLTTNRTIRCTSRKFQRVHVAIQDGWHPYDESNPGKIRLGKNGIWLATVAPSVTPQNAGKWFWRVCGPDKENERGYAETQREAMTAVKSVMDERSRTEERAETLAQRVPINNAVLRLSETERGRAVLSSFRAMCLAGASGLDSSGFRHLTTLTQALADGHREFLESIPAPVRTQDGYQKLVASHRELLAIAEETLKDVGGCDHSVGICACGIRNAVESGTAIQKEVSQS